MAHPLCRETHRKLIAGKCPWCGEEIRWGRPEEDDRKARARESVQHTVREIARSWPEELLCEGELTLDEFAAMLALVRRSPRVHQLAALLPRGKGLAWLESADTARRDLARLINIVAAMTPEERHDPRRLDEPRARQLAEQAGVRFDEVVALFAQFEGLRETLREIKRIRRRPNDEEGR